MPFSSEIKNFRLSCLMNQTEFGNALGVSFTTVNRWEKGKARPNIKAMKALKQYCEQTNRLYEPLEKSWREVMIEKMKYDFLNNYEQSTNIKHTAAPTVIMIVGAAAT